MAIVVEDGSLDETGANSFISLADFKAYAASRGLTLPADATVESYLVKAADYINSYSDRFIGALVDRDQPMAWPRDDVVIEGWEWEPNEIPRQVVSLQCALTVELVNGQDIYNPASALPVVREKVDVIEVEYTNPGQPAKMSKTRESQAILRLLLKNSGLSLVLRA